MMFTPRPKGLGKDNFLKLNDRESVVGIFKGVIYKFRRHWVGTKSEECNGAECLICKEDPKNNFPSFRFRVNFVTDKMDVKIFEGGAESYDLLTQVDKEWGISSKFVKITRRGLNKKTSYDFDVIDKEVPKSVEAQVEGVTLLALC